MTPLLLIIATIAALFILVRYSFVPTGLMLGPVIVLPITAGAFFSTSIMNSTPQSFCLSSAMATPSSKKKQSIDTSSTYPSPVSAVTPQGPGYPPASLVDLGISGLNELGSFPNPLSYSMSPTFTDQLAPLDNLYSMPLKVDDYTITPFFPAHNGLPATPHSPLSTYDSRTMSASPSYNSSLEVNATQNAQSVLLAQVHDPDYWVTTSCMRTTSPLEAVPAMKTPCTRSQLVQPYYPEAPKNINPPAFPAGRIAYPFVEIADEDNRTNLEQLPTLNQAVTSDRSLRTSEFTAHELPSNASRRRTTPKRQAKGEKAKGYACRLCGYVFTRRSNCMEHQRKHDPRSRESHPCNECDKTFGRKADLKRHTNNIHRGLRKHICVCCESRFTRPEALHKHLNDCARRLGEPTLSTSRDPDARPQPPRPLKDPASERFRTV